MLQPCRVRLSRPVLQTKSPDFKDRRTMIKKEVGVWLYRRDSMARFQAFCQQVGVRARGTVKVTSTEQHARCLRALKPIFPGQAIVTAPVSASFNFLVASKEQYATQNAFPLQLQWSNWNKRLEHLNGASINEMLCAGWITRMAARKGSSPFSPYAEWLLEDTTGRDGIATGIGRERGDGNPALDQMLQDMANDAGEELNDNMENLFRAYACIMLRAIPVDPRVVALQLPGSGADKVLKPEDLFVPTLVPLIDCVPQDDVGRHNTMLDYHTPEELTNPATLRDLGLAEKDVETPAIRRQGLLTLRAIEMISEGSYLAVRGWPKTEKVDQETISNTIMEQSIIKNNSMA